MAICLHFVVRPHRLLCLLGCLFLVPVVAEAEVVRVEVLSRETVEEAPSPYELITGLLHFEVDPAHPRNVIIADLDKAPRTERGTVAFSSDFRLLRPVQLPAEGSLAWTEISNRGGLSRIPGFAMERNWTVFEVGWEFDIPEAEKRLNVRVPVAVEPDGSPITGKVEAVFVLDEAKDSHAVVDLAVYPPVDVHDAERKLTVHQAAHLPGGEEIPHERWSLEGNRISLEGGFQPGLVYEVSWRSQNPPVAGLGFAAIRDSVSWLRYADDSLASVEHVAAFGASQTGRFLRDFLYMGFHTDTEDRAVFDGVLPHIAGAGHLDLNRRWATTRELALFRAAHYPFADRALPDPVSGLKEGLLENARAKHVPKVFYTNTSAEYWGAGRMGALMHTDPATGEDVPPLDSVRIYTFAGAQHGPGPFPPREEAEKVPGVHPYATNPVNFLWSVEALRVALAEWIVSDREPPASRYPHRADGTLVPVAELAFPTLPGVRSPLALPGGLRNRNPLHPDGAGAGQEMPLFVSQVDGDGNEMGGIRLPEIQVPLATHTGWLFRTEKLGAPHELRPVLRGSWIPFAKTPEEAREWNDPRTPLSERYASREDYLQRIREAAEALVGQRLLLPEHVDKVMEHAGQRWLWFYPAES